MKFIQLFLLCLLLLPCAESQNCNEDEYLLDLSMTLEGWSYETSWILKTGNNEVIASIDNGDYNNLGPHHHQICIPKGECMVFVVNDLFGDGGAVYTLDIPELEFSYAGDGNFGSQEVVEFNCPPGQGCLSSIPITEGNHTAANKDFWYAFQPTQIGAYKISTCTDNACDTKLWIYSDCNTISQTNSQAGATTYNDDSDCGIFAEIPGAPMDTAVVYFIRVGGDCEGEINFTITYSGPIMGCTDPTSCNFQPLATEDDGSCIPQGSPNCPEGPDLLMREDNLRTSIELDRINNTDDCLIEEGCLKGYGWRDIVRFTTTIDNIGETDYFIGIPTEDNPQFTFDNCHNHYHYDGYAEYILFDEAGTELPIGFKNGFCVLDLWCNTGSAKYWCNNMGITSGCSDEYGSYLECQWIDITDVADGNYTFVTRVNWDNAPDAAGRIEKNSANNWAQACISIDRSSGILVIDVLEDCQQYVDCLGQVNGSAQPDCQGTCNGIALRGDVDGNGVQELDDAQDYVSMILGSDAATTCNDLNADNKLNIYDAALLSSCINYGNNHNHAGTGQHDHCNFPAGTFNFNDEIFLEITDFNTDEKYIDISIRNNLVDVVAYQLSISGLKIRTVDGVQPLTQTLWPSAIFGYAVSSGVITAISFEDEVLARSPVYQPLLRVYYESITDYFICIATAEEVVNHNYEQTVVSIENGCVASEPSGIVDITEVLTPKVIPNPFSNIAKISFNNPAGESIDLRVYNTTGKLVAQYGATTNNSFEISKGDLTQGFYVYTLSGKKGVATGKMVIK